MNPGSVEIPSPLPPAAAAAPKHRSLGCVIGLVIFGLFLAGMMALAAMAYHALHFGAQAQDLRAAVQTHFGATRWQPQIEVRLGSVACALFRSIVIQIADDPDATAVLQAARAVQFGLYEVEAPSSATERGRLLQTTTSALGAHGWSRVAAVVDGPAIVMVFAPAAVSESAEELEMGVLVLDGSNLVIAVVEVRMQPLWELVQRHARASGAPGLER